MANRIRMVSLLLGAALVKTALGFTYPSMGVAEWTAYMMGVDTDAKLAEVKAAVRGRTVVKVACRVEITRAGLGDFHCPPSGISVLHNNLPCSKKVNWVQGSTHGYVPKESRATRSFPFRKDGDA